MSYEGKGVWCVAEARHGELQPTIYELLTAGRKIADARGETVTAVLIGAGVAAKADEVAGRGADKVLVFESDALKEFVDGTYEAVLAKAAEADKPKTILLPGTVYGKSLAPRLAIALQAGLAADAVGIELDDQKRLVVTRTSYSGNVIASVAVRSETGPEMATLRPMAFDKAGDAGKKGEVVNGTVEVPGDGRASFVSFSADQGDEVDLGAAETIVAGGRGLGKAEGFDLLRKLAKALNAGVGASRAAVDSGWIPYKHQVGLTGRAVRPKLYVACGISGQIQHLAGMNASDTIVAVNTDAECPMMKQATYAVEGDLYKVLPALIDEIEKARA